MLTLISTRWPAFQKQRAALLLLLPWSFVFSVNTAANADFVDFLIKSAEEETSLFKMQQSGHAVPNERPLTNMQVKGWDDAIIALDTVERDVGGTPEISQSDLAAANITFTHGRRRQRNADEGVRQHHGRTEPGATGSRHKRQTQEACEPGWTKQGGSCYRVTASLSWSEARQACLSINGFLADIANQDDENNIVDFLNMKGVPNAWIGLNDQQTEGEWKWDNGAVTSYTHWSTGEPNDVGGNEDCVEIRALNRRGWNDHVCSVSFPGVCRSTEACEPGWTKQGGSCYRVTAALSWSDARQACLSMNGFLTDIANQDDENNIVDFLNRKGVPSAWIGLNDQQTEGEWKWDAGAVTSYTHWSTGAPHDVDGNKDCVEIRAQNRRGWKDHVCSVSFPGVCRSTEACEPGWTKQGRSCYRVTASLSWSDARQACLSMNGFLTDITNQDDENNIADFLNRKGVPNAWIGLSDQQTEGEWKWDNGAVTSYTHWSTGEPNDVGGNEDCVEIRALNRRGWNDHVCSVSFPGVCKSTEACELGWTKQGRSCYTVTASLSWSDARQACLSMNGFLSDIANKDDENNIVDFLNRKGVPNAWIGLNDQQTEGEWKWNTGAVTSYTHWSTGEPNDVGGNEDCVEIRAQHRRGWNDHVCSVSLPGVCKSTGNDISCGGRVSSPAHIMSPGFPGQYMIGRECRWTVQASNANNSVLLKFESLSTDEFDDYLVIKDGSEFQYTFSGKLQPNDLILRSPFEIIFVSNNVLRNHNHSGFNITISDVARRSPRICRSGHWLMHGEQCVSVLWHIPYVPWTKGRSLCRSMGGFLVEPDDVEKLRDIGEFLAYHASQTDEVWIGLKRVQADYEWRWETGRPLRYSSWATGQPDKDARNVSCAALTMQSVSGAWISDDCNALKAPMCMLLRRNGDLRCYAE